MKYENELKLVEKYPNLYKDYNGDMRYTCMVWGFSCGNGWYDLIDRLSRKLEPLGIVASQVKEKFGGLRFYIQSGSEKVYELIDEAEAESYKTCENCGESGKPNEEGYWIKTLCDKCREKYNNGKFKTWGD